MTTSEYADEFEELKKIIDLDAVKKANVDTEHLRHYQHNNKALKAYIDYFEKSHSNGIKMRKVFFVFTIILMSFAIICSAIAVIILATKKVSLIDIATAISAMVGFVSAIIVLPKIIAEHLYPKDEDKYVTEIISKSLSIMQQNDNKYDESK